MKRQLMKRGMMGIYAAICAGMLLVTGCAGTETNAKTETERMEATERQESNPVNTAGKAEKEEVPEYIKNHDDNALYASMSHLCKVRMMPGTGIQIQWIPLQMRMT